MRVRIAAAAPGRDVTVVAVTKGFPAEVAAEAFAAGCLDLGENYAQELGAKAAALGAAQSGTAAALGAAQSGTAALGAAPCWHFLGRIQRNKVRSVAPLVSLWQSVDRPEVVNELARRAPGAAMLVQVNLTGEPQRAGCDWGEVPALVDRALEAGLDVRGLMGVGPLGDPAGSRGGFRRLVELAERLSLPVRSIGMTDDLEIALEEGSTMVRVGTGLFGPRPARSAPDRQ